MKIVVTVKLVPDTNADKRIDPSTKRLVRNAGEAVVNPFDEYAIEAALKVRDSLGDGSTVTVLTMAPASGKDVVRKALAMGADDAVMLSDDAFAGADVWATADALAHALRIIGFDMIVAGTQSTDAITGAMPGALAEALGVPGLTNLREIQLDGEAVTGKRETDTGYQRIRAALPALVSMTKSANQPRYPSLKGIMGAKKKDIRMLAAAEFGLAAPAGSDGAKTELREIAAAPPRAKGRVITAATGSDGARAIVDFLKERKLV